MTWPCKRTAPTLQTAAHTLAAVTVLAATLSMVDTASAGPIGFSVRAHTGDRLYSIDLATGIGTDLGQLVFGEAEGLALVDGTLYALGGTDELWDITTAPGIKIGNTGPRNGGVDAGLAESASGTLYNLQGHLAGYSHLYTINSATGAATLVGSSNFYTDGLAIDALGHGFAADGVHTDSIYSVDLNTGGMALIGSMGLGNTTFHSGLSFDSAGVLWMVTHFGQVYTVSTSTGHATWVSNITDKGYRVNGFQGLAIASQTVAPVAIPEPGTLGLIALGMTAGAIRRRVRRDRVR